jgi:hypothetical protein
LDNAKVILKEGNASLAINITGYEFPKLKGSEDANWLDVTLKLSLLVGNFYKTFPCLTTAEVEELIDWLGEVLKNFEIFNNWQSNILSTDISFTEPNLNFAIRGGTLTHKGVVFRVYFWAEFMPPFKKALNHNPLDDVNSDFWLDFMLDKEQLEKIVKDREVQASKFPTRF